MLILTAAVYSAFPADGQEKTNIAGIVLDENGTAVEGADVYLYKFPVYRIFSDRDYLSARVKTGKDGKFLFKDVSKTPEDHFYVTAGRKDLSFGGSTSIMEREVSSGMRIILKSPSEISGKVIDKTGKPVKEAIVAVNALADSMTYSMVLGDKYNNILKAKTDSKGEFVIGKLPQGSKLSLTIESDGYARLSVSGRRGGNYDDYFPVKAGVSNLVYTLVGEGKISGSITDPATGEKITSIPLLCQLQSEGGSPYDAIYIAEYDGEGNFIFRKLSAGKYTINSVGRLEGNLAGYALPAKKNVEIAEGGSLELSLTLVKTGWVTGKVTDETTGKPIQDAKLYITGPSAPQGNFPPLTASIMQDGTYRIALCPGENNLTCYPGGNYRSQQDNRGKKVEVIQGETVGDVNFSFAHIPIIQGIAVDEQGNPVGDADISSFGFSRVNRTAGTDGRFEIAIEPVSYGMSNYLIARDKKTDKSGFSQVPSNPDDGEIKIILRTSASIKGKIVNKEGKGLTSSTIQCMLRLGNRGIFVTGAGYPGWTAAIDKEGNFLLDGLFGNQTYYVMAQASGYGQETKQNIYLAYGQVFDTGTILLKDADTFIDGKVLDEEGNPQPNARVLAHGDGQQHRDTTSNKDGTFHIEGLVEGKVNINASSQYDSANPQAYLSGSVRDVQTGRKDVEIVLRSRQANIQAKNMTGKPAPKLAAVKSAGIKKEDIQFGNNKIYVLVSLSIYSPPTKRILPAINELAGKYKGKDVVFIGLPDNSSKPEDVQKLMDSGSIKFPVVFSEPAPQNAFGLKIYSDLGIDTIPQVIMVDKKGIVRYNRVVQQDIETTLEFLLQEPR